MACFKQISQTFIRRKMAQYASTLFQAFDEEVRDTDVFRVFEEGLTMHRVERMIRLLYSPQEVRRMTSRRLPPNERLDFTDDVDGALKALWSHTGVRRKTRILMRGLYEAMCATYPAAEEPEGIERRLGKLSEMLNLSELEREILTLAYVLDVTTFDWPVRVNHSNRPLYFAMALDRSHAEVLAAMEAGGRLCKFSVLDEDWDFGSSVYGGYLMGMETEALEQRFFRRVPTEGALPWAFYGAMAETHGEFLKRLFRANGGKGKLNILLYGAPGTGKTSFARSLVAELGGSLYEVRQGDERKQTMDATARMVGIRLCNAQAAMLGNAVMVVDEADELLRDAAGGFLSFFRFDTSHTTEKGLVNTLLDEMLVPTIWISNVSASHINEAVRRRFDYSIAFQRLNATQREAIWGNTIRKFELGDLIPAEKIPDLAMRYATSAGGIATVLENLRKLSPAKAEVDETIDTLMRQHCELMGAPTESKFILAKDYSLEGLNIRGRIKPDNIVRCARNFFLDVGQARGIDRPRMNLLLFGPPGSGKTEFVKYLGERVRRRVLVKKASDLLDCYVGGTEMLIRGAFREAEAANAILFFDEIDSLLQDRASAGQHWEVTQVNELLQQMEAFDGMMVAATNLVESLDPAVMRRFTYKLQFDYLDDAGKRHFFRHLFRSDLTAEEDAQLCAIPSLCPGDFRTVRQALFYLGAEVSNADRLDALRAEVAMKPRACAAKPIGFGG